MARAMLKALLGLLLLAGGWVNAAIDYALVPRVAPKLIKIHAAGGDGRVAIGTGVMVARDTVVTNCHVTRSATYIELWSGGQRFVATRQSADLGRDVCVLFSAGMPDLVVPIAASRPKVGSSVLGVGYSGGLELRFGIGEVRALHDYDGAAVIQTNAVFDSGASGGGLFNEQGELLGFVTFRKGGQSKDAYHFSVPSAWANPLLDSNRATNVLPLSGPLAFWAQPLERQPFFLQAISLQAESQWTRLQDLALRWTKAEPDNGSAWRTLAVSSRAVNQPAAAVVAGRRAVTLHPDDPNAWLSLASACASARQGQCLDEARTALARLDPRYLEDLNREIGTR
jgi:serine protease Do